MDNLCPICKQPLYVKSGGYKAKNDDTPDKETKIYLIQYQYCGNKECKNVGEIVGTIEHKMEKE